MEHLTGPLMVSKVPVHSEILGTSQAARLRTPFPETTMEPRWDAPISVYRSPICCSWPGTLLILTGSHRSEALRTVGGSSLPRAQWVWCTSIRSSLCWPCHDCSFHVGQRKPHGQALVGTEGRALPSIINATGLLAQWGRRDVYTVYTAFWGEGEKSNKTT